MATSNTQVIPAKQDQVAVIRSSLESMVGDFRTALPAHVTPEKFIRVVITSLRMNPDLLSCDRDTLFGATMKCAQDGLLPDGREAAFVKYGTKVQYMPMVGGICKKARNSGEIASLDAQVVCENDKYEAWIDEKGQHFKHTKAVGERGKAILTYAYAITKDGSLFFEEMSEGEMEDVKKVSRAGASGPWNGPFANEMRRKTVLRRLAKYRIPSSTDLDDVIRADDDMYDLSRDADGETKAAKLNAAFNLDVRPGEPSGLEIDHGPQA